MRLRTKRGLLIVTAVSCFAFTTADAAGVKPYVNAKSGVNISYPADWVKSENVPGALVAFGAPKEKANLKMVENVTLTVQELPQEFATMDKYTKMYEKQREQTPDPPKVIESKKMKLGGQPAQSIVCVGKQNGMDIQFWQVWTVKDAKAYLFTYGAEKSSYTKFLKEAERIIASLSFTKPAPKKK